MMYDPQGDNGQFEVSVLIAANMDVLIDDGRCKACRERCAGPMHASTMKYSTGGCRMARWIFCHICIMSVVAAARCSMLIRVRVLWSRRA